MLSQKPIKCPQILLDKAKKGGAALTAVVCAASAIVMESAKEAQAAGLAAPILIGKADEILVLAQKMNWSSDNFTIINADSDEDAALKATTLVNDGKAAAIMKGDIHTDVFMGAIVNRDTGIRTGKRLCHAFYMTVPDSDKYLIISDAAVNIAPNMKTKQAIIENTVSLAHALGTKQPKVAILSATEEVNQAMPSSVEAAELSTWAQDNIKDAIVHGPLAMDNAISSSAANIKNISNPVAGHADIVVVPTIEAGNILFKTLVYYNSACAAGIVIGAKVPIILTSRADPPEARLASMAIANILASHSTS